MRRTIHPPRPKVNVAWGGAANLSQMGNGPGTAIVPRERLPRVAPWTSKQKRRPPAAARWLRRRDFYNGSDGVSA